ncbi:MAG: OmpP1/FadL family transporter [Bdellovibrionales bacterium]
MRNVTKYLSILIVGTALVPMTANAAGFYVQEISSSSAGAANAGAAAMPRDASVIFHNPSAITHLDGAQVNGALHLLYTDTELVDQGSTIGGFATSLSGFGDDGGNPGGLTTIPNLYGALPITDTNDVWLGIGLTTPFGLGPEYDNGFFGSLLVTEADLSVIDITPSIAYQVNDYLSLGLSGIVQYAELNYQFAAVTAPVGSRRVTADDVSLGYKVSATLTPNDDLTVGLQYRSRTNLDFEGDLDVATALTTSAAGTLNLPDIATFGISYDVNDKWTVMGGVEWFGWNETDVATIRTGLGSNLPVAFNYENTINVSVGAEYKYDDTWTLRAGYQYDETPTTAQSRSPLNPDGDRHWIAAGATQTINEKWSLDYGVTYIDIEDANINRTLAAGTAVIAEGTDSFAVIGTVGVNYKF